MNKIGICVNITATLTVGKSLLAIEVRFSRYFSTTVINLPIYSPIPIGFTFPPFYMTFPQYLRRCVIESQTWVTIPSLGVTPSSSADELRISIFFFPACFCSSFLSVNFKLHQILCHSVRSH